MRDGARHLNLRTADWFVHLLLVGLPSVPAVSLIASLPDLDSDFHRLPPSGWPGSQSPNH